MSESGGPRRIRREVIDALRTERNRAARSGRAPDRPLRVAVIGAGAIARLRHVPGYQLAARAGLCEVVALCDPVLESARQLAADAGVRGVFADWRDVVARDDVDVVSVATPNVYHEEISIAALDGGKHVMCEKPLAMTFAGAKRMLAAAERSGKRTSVNFRYRWVPSAKLLIDLARGGELGEIFHVYMNYLNGSRTDPNAPIRWRQVKAQAGSGVLGDLGSHMIDLAHALVGPVRRVTAHLRTFTNARPDGGGGQTTVDVDDACSLIAEFASGAQGTINCSGCAIGWSNHQRVELYGTKGSAIYEIDRADRGGDRLQVCFGASQARHVSFAPAPVPAQHAGASPLDPFVELIEAIRAGRDPAVTFADGARAQEVIEAAERAAARGGWVELPLGE